MELENLIQEKRDAILGVLTKYGFYNVRIFGSVAKKTSKHGSDLDLLVDIAPQCDRRSCILQAASELQELLGCSVDIVVEEQLHWDIYHNVISEAIPL
jgi:predicted nucleotidyltransferase